MIRPPWIVAAVLVATAMPAAAQLQVDINRPRTPFDCSLENGIRWYGSKERCLQELCAGGNSINEWIFDSNGKRRRRNPCYRVDPFNFDE